MGYSTLKLNNLKIMPPKRSVPAGAASYAKPQSIASSSSMAPAKSAATPIIVKRAIDAADRRRSQRVLLRVRANIFVALHGKPAAFEVITLSVNHQGALVVMAENLPPDTRLVLEHAGTKERVACKVGRAAREMPEGFHVPIEFDSPAPDFWRIAFPSTDWSADDV